ncbi:MAG TPA: class I SAM-dependent methyltransferase [Usitatibacter sp.]|nr:class I SAM-dependent methyltransferase [Usitatibacter sp.]
MIVHDSESVAPDSHPKYPRFLHVPPLPSSSLMDIVGAPSIENFYVVGEAWAHIVSRVAPREAMLLDIGCGCGRTARFLLPRPDIRYAGFDVARPAIEWCRLELVPLSSGRFEFHYLDVYSGHYNPRGALRGSDVRFPANDAAIDVAFAASLFTHLLEPDARHYLAETARTLKREGLLVASIHDEVPAGERFAGNEARVDVTDEYFTAMAAEAGLARRESLGLVCGQATLVFERR